VTVHSAISFRICFVLCSATFLYYLVKFVFFFGAFGDIQLPTELLLSSGFGIEEHPVEIETFHCTDSSKSNQQTSMTTRFTCVSRYLQLSTGRFCWCIVLLPHAPCNQHIRIREKMLEFSSPVLSTSHYISCT